MSWIRVVWGNDVGFLRKVGPMCMKMNEVDVLYSWHMIWLVNEIKNCGNFFLHNSQLHEAILIDIPHILGWQCLQCDQETNEIV